VCIEVYVCVCRGVCMRACARGFVGTNVVDPERTFTSRHVDSESNTNTHYTNTHTEEQTHTENKQKHKHRHANKNANTCTHTQTRTGRDKI
jgi:hypothetical protein